MKGLVVHLTGLVVSTPSPIFSPADLGFTVRACLVDAEMKATAMIGSSSGSGNSVLV